MAWYNTRGSSDDTVISTSVSLIRSIEGLSFREGTDIVMLSETHSALSDILHKNGYTYTDLSKLSRDEEGVLIEKGYSEKGVKHLFFSDENEVSVMVGGDQHVKIRATLPGLDTLSALERARRADSLADSVLSYAFDERLGYLTPSPEDLGCGLRVSTVMFLPALYESGLIDELSHHLSEYGILLDGESGYFKTLSSTHSLGHSEKEICEMVSGAALYLSSLEISKREELYLPELIYTNDRIMRSLGAARYALLMSKEDLIKTLSDLRLGIYFETIGYNMDYGVLGNIMIGSMPHHLALAGSKEKSASAKRAEHLSSALLTILKERVS